MRIHCYTSILCPPYDTEKSIVHFQCYFIYAVHIFSGWCIYFWGKMQHASFFMSPHGTFSVVPAFFGFADIISKFSVDRCWWHFTDFVFTAAHFTQTALKDVSNEVWFFQSNIPFFDSPQVFTLIEVFDWRSSGISFPYSHIVSIQENVDLCHLSTGLKQTNHLRLVAHAEKFHIQYLYTAWPLSSCNSIGSSY